jgi:hypothetical protein
LTDTCALTVMAGSAAGSSTVASSFQYPCEVWLQSADAQATPVAHRPQAHRYFNLLSVEELTWMLPL